MIDLIFLTFNNFDNTIKKCLESISYFDRRYFSINIVDNGSVDGSKQKLFSYLHDRCLPAPIVLESNKGYAGGMNHGASMSTGKWLVLISSDTFFFENSLEKIKSTLIKSDSDVIGFLTNAAGTAQEIIKENDEGTISAVANKIHNLETNIEIPLYRTDFFCVAIRRSCWNDLNGLDQTFGKGYYEDFDFCLRARKKGFKIAMSEDVFVGHTGSATLKLDPSQKQLIKRNKIILSARHQDAIFLHSREDNLRALNFYLDFLRNNPASTAITERLRLRINRAEKNMPKSLFKKLYYLKKLHKIKKELLGNKIAINP